MFSKIGTTLADLGHEVHILGFPATATSPSSVQFHPLPSFRRISVGRILAPFRVLRQLLILRPDTILVCTHELLLFSVLAKVFLKCRLLYDVQENYYLNIRHTNAFPLVLRRVLALFVRMIEKMTAGIVDHFLLAEHVYREQLLFTRGKSSVLENRFLVHTTRASIKKRGHHNLLFSGTVADSTGIWEAIDLASALHACDNRVTLTVVGHVPTAGTWARLRTVTAARAFVQLQVSQTPVPYAAILAAIDAADIGIISYPPNAATAGRIPTKYFEYVALGLGILCTTGQPLSGRILDGRQGIIVDADDPAETLFARIQNFDNQNITQVPSWDNYREILAGVC